MERRRCENTNDMMRISKTLGQTHDEFAWGIKEFDAELTEFRVELMGSAAT